MFQEIRPASIIYQSKMMLLIILDTATIPVISSSPRFPHRQQSQRCVCWVACRPRLLLFHVFTFA